MNSESFISDGKIYTSVSFTAQEMKLTKRLLSSLPKKEIYKMANKTFSIIDNGAAIDPRYTIKYSFVDECDRYNRVTKDLANLTVAELKTLRDSLDNLVIDDTTEDKLRGFGVELRRISKRYGVHGRLFAGDLLADYDNEVNNPSYMSIGGTRISEMTFGSHGVEIEKTEKIYV